MRQFFAVTLLAVCSTTAFSQQSRQPQAKSAEQALSAFFAAFNNLDWPAFRACFSDTATVFYPMPEHAERIDSPDQLEKAWLDVFDKIRKSSGRNSPPYMDLSPRDLRIDHLSPDVTLATFHLGSRNVVGRRTVVLKRYADDWKIVHLHASTLNTH